MSRSLVAGSVHELLAIVRYSLRCSKLLEEADSATLQRSRAISYVPCPANYHRLGHISWVLMEDEGTARIGVGDLLMKSIEGIQEFELASPGEELLQGIPCGQAIALDQLKHEIMCPLSGQIIEVNDCARSDPSLVEKDPYIRGWLYQVLPTNPKSDLQWLSLQRPAVSLHRTDRSLSFSRVLGRGYTAVARKPPESQKTSIKVVISIRILSLS